MMKDMGSLQAQIPPSLFKFSACKKKSVWAGRGGGSSFLAEAGSIRVRARQSEEQLKEQGSPPLQKEKREQKKKKEQRTQGLTAKRTHTLLEHKNKHVRVVVVIYVVVTPKQK